MPARIHLQSPQSILRVGSWLSHEDFAVHPKGSQPKRTLICPIDTTEPYLIPGHSYIFKTAKVHWQVQQVWSEVIAYRIGALVGLDVPPCFVAVNESTGEVGVLMEFFFGYPEEAEPARLVHASDYMTRILADRKKGRPHGIRPNLKLCRTLQLEGVVQWWGTVLTYDALIGNTDRHPDNWGFLVRQRRGEEPVFSFAPVFDNGTSLGYEQPDGKLVQLLDSARIGAYINRGTHHCGWDTTEDGPAPHIDLCARFLSAYPEASAAMQSVIRFAQDQIADIVNQCAQFDVSIPFTADRASFVSALIEARRARLAAVLGE